MLTPPLKLAGSDGLMPPIMPGTLNIPPMFMGNPPDMLMLISGSVDLVLVTGGDIF